jgi:hypothetical protein
MAKQILKQENDEPQRNTFAAQVNAMILWQNPPGPQIVESIQFMLGQLCKRHPAEQTSIVEIDRLLKELADRID